MDIFAQFATDPNKELEGVWVPIGPADKKTKVVPEIKVARSGNKRHGRIISKLYEANKSTLELKNDAAESKGEEITIDAMAKGILLGWRGLSFQKEALPDAGTEGSELSAERRLEIAKKLLAVKDFRALVMKHSEDFTRFKVVQEEEEGND